LRKGYHDIGSYGEKALDSKVMVLPVTFTVILLMEDKDDVKC
jgi:hypothetical protein